MDVLNAVRAVVPDFQPYADLEHALMRDRIHRAISAMQTEIAAKAYRDGYLDAVALAEERMREVAREIMASDIEDCLRALGIRIGRRAS